MTIPIKARIRSGLPVVLHLSIAVTLCKFYTHFVCTLECTFFVGILRFLLVIDFLFVEDCIIEVTTAGPAGCREADQ